MVESPQKLLAELIALPSVNPAFLPEGDDRAGEGRMSDFLAARAARAGLSVELQPVFSAAPGRRERSNLLVRWSPPKARRRVLLAPHLDTVGAVDMSEELFRPRAERGRLYGRGACDTKGSVAAMFIALLQMAAGGDQPSQTEIIFLGLVDEENAQQGSRTLAASRLKADLAIVGEPTQGRIVCAHKGDLWLKIVTRGKAAHGARPELGDNAVHTMARAIELLETNYAKTLRKRRHPLLGSPTINVGTVRGGTQPNIVPDFCEIQVDRRTIPGEKDREVQREIISFLKERGVRARLVSAKHNTCGPLQTDCSHPFIRQWMELAGQEAPVGVDFFCDAAIIAAGGTPCVVFGPGNIAQAHTSNEWISLRSLEGATELLTRFLRALP